MRIAAERDESRPTWLHSCMSNESIEEAALLKRGYIVRELRTQCSVTSTR